MIGAVLFALLPLIPVVLYITTIGTGSLEVSQQQNLVNVNRSVKNYIDTLLEQEQRFLNSFVNEFMVQKAGEMLDAGLPNLCQFYLDQYKSVYHDASTYASFFVIDKSGKIVADTSEILAGSNIGQKSFFKKAMKGNVIVGDVVALPDESLGLYIVTPLIHKQVNNDTETLSGAIGILLKLDSIQKKLEKIILGHTGYIILATRNGILLSHPNPEKINSHIKSLPGFSETSLVQETEEFIHVNHGQKKQLILFMPIGTAPWSLISVIPEEEYLDAINKMRNIIGMVALLFTLLTFFTTRKIFDYLVHNRLNALTGVTREISDGKLHIPIDKSMMATDEIGELAYSIEDMRERLQVSRDKLETYSRTLEEKVDERTSELQLLNIKLEKLAEEAQSASRLKSDFLANMSHEIRTPMNGVIGMTELLLGTTLAKDQEKYALNIRKSGNSLLSLINDILDFSKIEANKLDLENVEFDIHCLIDEVINITGSQEFHDQLEIIYWISPDVPPFLVGDPGRLRQILTNLVSNARKFTSTGEILVKVNVERKFDNEIILYFSVQDTGIGIPVDKQLALFEVFTQVDMSTSRKYGGTGLGLAISKQLCNLMGGDIGVTSKAEEGSTFWFTVRLTLSKKKDSDVSIDNKDIFSKAKILIVDNSSSNLAFISHHLKHWNAEIFAATDGSEALELLKKGFVDKNPFDIAILDSKMPRTNGVELGKSIKQDIDLASTRLILMLHSGPKDTNLALDPHLFSTIIPKPVQVKELHSALNIALDMKPHPSSLSGEAVQLGNKNWSGRVLVAEDDMISQQVTSAMLKNIGCSEVDVVSNGIEAIEAIKTQDYALVFMDLSMPKLDGLEATKLIRNEIEGNNSLRIVGLTAHAIKGYRQKCIDAGMNDYISKPISSESLQKVLGKWMR